VTGDRPLRLAVFLTTVAGIGTLVAAHLLVPLAGVAGAALLASASVWAAQRSSAPIRRWTSTGLLAGTAAMTLAAAGGLGGTDGLGGVGPTLAVLLVGLTVAHALVLESVRDLTVALALGGAMVLVAAGLAPGLGLAVPLGLAWVAGVAALVLAHDLHGRTGVDAVLGNARPGRRAAVTVLTAVLVGLLAFLLVPRPPSLSDLATRSRLAGASTGGTDISRSATAWSSGVLDMRWRGALGDAPVLTVPADSPGLWRAGVLGAYDGTSWSAPVGPRTSLLGADPVRTIPPGPEDGPMPGERLRTDEVVPAGRPYDTLVAPGRPVRVVTDSAVSVSDGLVQLDGEPDAYRVTSAAPGATPARLRAASGADPSARWTALPATLPARVSALGRELVAAAPTRYDAVREVEEHLRATATYRLDSPVPGAGEDAVDVFLFRDRTGFCEQFAAAAVVLLRAGGVPARLVTGFSGGAAEADRRVLRESDAHAWAEVWFPGVGWVPSDPTAGAALADTGADTLAGMRDTLTGLLGTAAGRLLLAVVLVVPPALVWLYRRRRPRTAAVAPPRARGALLAAYDRFETALAAAGSPRRPVEGLEELALRVPAAAAALGVVSRALYAPAAPARPESLAAIETFDRLSASLLASPSRPEPSRSITRTSP
jgi:hypothetical protein